MSKWIAIGSFMFLLGTLVATAARAETAASNCADEAHYRVIEKKELVSWVEKKTAFIIDVNSKESFDKNHVPGAIHFGSSEKELPRLLPKQKDAPIVAYCGGAMCNAWKKAAEEACKLGYTNIRHFKGGIQGWTQGS